MKALIVDDERDLREAGRLLLEAQGYEVLCAEDGFEGLGALKDLFEKNNYELASVDASAPDAHEPFRGCTVVVIAGAKAPFGADETNLLRAWLLEGGSLFAALGPTEGGPEANRGARILEQRLML